MIKPVSANRLAPLRHLDLHLPSFESDNSWSPPQSPRHPSRPLQARRDDTKSMEKSEDRRQNGRILDPWRGCVRLDSQHLSNIVLHYQVLGPSQSGSPTHFGSHVSRGSWPAGRHLKIHTWAPNSSSSQNMAATGAGSANPVVSSRM